jgi:hypothetical protein
MDGGNEQRVATKFCFKAGLSATETLVLVQQVNGNEALNRSNVFRWYSRFRDGRELIKDDVSGGRPKSTRTEASMAVVAADLVKNYRPIASRMTAESLNIAKTVVLQIMIEDFCSRDFFFLHDNAPVHKATFANFLPKKMLHFITPRTLRIYLRQTIFCSPS